MDAASKAQSLAAGADRRAVRHLARRVPLIAASTTCSALADLFAENPSLPAYVVRLDNGGYSLVDRNGFMPQYLFGYNRELHQRTPIGRFSRARTLIVSEETQTEQVGLRLTSEYPELLTSGFVIIRQGEYVGIGLSIDLMRAIAELADEANAAKSTFLANMNHEIRTPLSSVIGNLELLALSSLDGEQREIVGTAKISADALLELVGDLLDLSKLQAGHLQVETVETEVARLVNEVLTIVAPRARQKGLRLTARIGANVPARIATDPFRLRQVLINLLGNAVKFTQSGGAFLTVRPVGEPDAARLRFEVLDTGPGFDPAKAEELFRPFVQEDASTTRRFGGTGLGLSISKGIVEKLGGEIGCSAEPGLGATFWCELPAKERVGRNEIPPPDIGDHAVLLLGDRQLRQSIEQQFRDRGVTALPEEAWAAGAAGGPSLVVVATSQSEEPLVLERLPSLLRFNAPIIVASSEPSDAFGYRAHRVGADHIVRLPEELADIVTLLAAEKGQLSLPAVPGTARPKPFAAATDKILIIDDTETNRVLATRQLQQLGLASDTAADGQEGLEKAAARSYSAILVDDSMPVMDGAEFMRRWREFEAERGRPRTPLIAMTARAQVGEAERYLSLGADDYLPKPVTLSKLDATLKKWLDAASGERQGEAPAAIERNARTRNGSQAVDLDALAETIGDADPATLREMMEVFLADFPELMARVLRSVGSGGGAELARAAHAAKSAAGSACAKPLSALLGAIEDRAARPVNGELKALVAEAESEFARVQSELGARFGGTQHRRPPLPSSVPLQREPIVADSPDAA